jgi:hypothetical protein
VAGGASTLDRAVDGLQFGTRDALVAYLRGGVTTGVSAPTGAGFLAGVSTAFRTAAGHKLERGALLQEEVAVHVKVSSGSPVSVSTQIATLRRLLTTESGGALETVFQQVAKGKKALLVSADSADIMASIIHLKQEIAESTGYKIRLTFVGGAEAHLIACKCPWLG